jgi:hypothetical protein
MAPLTRSHRKLLLPVLTRLVSPTYWTTSWVLEHPKGEATEGSSGTMLVMGFQTRKLLTAQLISVEYAPERRQRRQRDPGLPRSLAVGHLAAGSPHTPRPWTPWTEGTSTAPGEGGEEGSSQDPGFLQRRPRAGGGEGRGGQGCICTGWNPHLRKAVAPAGVSGPRCPERASPRLGWRGPGLARRPLPFGRVAPTDAEVNADNALARQSSARRRSPTLRPGGPAQAPWRPLETAHPALHDPGPGVPRPWKPVPS